jgi:hypothetical protein
MHSFYNLFAERRNPERWVSFVNISDRKGYMFRTQAIGATALEAA